jgi:hypothetical protein
MRNGNSQSAYGILHLRDRQWLAVMSDAATSPSTGRRMTQEVGSSSGVSPRLGVWRGAYIGD